VSDENFGGEVIKPGDSIMMYIVRHKNNLTWTEAEAMAFKDYFGKDKISFPSVGWMMIAQMQYGEDVWEQGTISFTNPDNGEIISFVNEGLFCTGDRRYPNENFDFVLIEKFYEESIVFDDSAADKATSLK
jgi:hypothetical protein